MNFENFGLSNPLLASLEKLRFKVPTPVQQKTIPFVLDGRDVLVSSQTGTGKTGAFCIPIISKLSKNLEDKAIVVTPTRELATQVAKMFAGFLGGSRRLKTALLIGGDSVSKQLKQLKQNPNIVVGTPGRINDLLRRKSLKLNNTRFLVLDETDRMLDMGFAGQIDDIVRHLPKERQSLLFSATLPKNIIKLSEKYMKNPQRIAVGSSSTPIDAIKQEIIHIKNSAKQEELFEQLAKREGSVLVFMKTKHSTERMAKKLKSQNYKVDAIHGDLRHNKRERVIKAFRNQKYRILVATDVAARGLDIPHIQHVINYDIPQCPEDYIHRIGRTARAGEKGEAISFVCPADKKKWNDIDCLMNPQEKKKKEPDSKKPSKKQRSKKPFLKNKAKKSFSKKKNKNKKTFKRRQKIAA